MTQKLQWKISITGLTIIILISIAMLGLSSCQKRTDAVADDGLDTTDLQPMRELKSGTYLVGFVFEIENEDQRCLIVAMNGRQATAMSCVEKPQ